MTVAPSRAGGPGFASAELLERVSDGVYVVDRDWTYVFANPAGAARLASTPRELVGRNLWTVLPQTVGTDFERQCRRAMDDREPVALEQHRPGSGTWNAIRIFPRVGSALTALTRRAPARQPSGTSGRASA